jgi:hypothetical protein
VRLRIGAFLIATLVAPLARAQTDAYPVELVAAIAPDGGAGADGTILVGRSGQLYHSAAPGRWQRRDSGGVAIDLRAAVRAGAEELLAIGADTPPFRFSRGAWRAEPLPNRGAAALTATGAAPVLVIGRHIYALQSGTWQRRVSAPRRVTAAWAGDSKMILLASADGGLTRWDGRRFTAVRTPLAPADPIAALVGRTPAALFGRAESGAWIRIDRAGTAEIALEQELEGFEEHAFGLGPDAALWLAGTVPTPTGARRAVLARAERNRLVLAGELPLATGDRVAVVVGHAPTGELLVASRAGAVRVRDKKGTWREGAASGAVPPPNSPSVRASGGPARTR